MHVYRFIASRFRMGVQPDKDGGRPVSSVSTRIGLVSVALSMAVVVVALAVVIGFRSEIKEKASGFMGEVSLVVPGQSPMNEKYPFSQNATFLRTFGGDAMECLEDLREVDHIQRVAYVSGLLKTEENILGAYFKGVDSLYNFSFFESVLEEGALPDYRGRISSDILVSRRMADKMGFVLDSTVTAYFIGEEDVKVRKFRICGIYDAQLEDIDNSLIVADIRQAQRISGWGKDEISTIEVALKRGVGVDRGLAAVEQFIFEHGEEDDPSLFSTSVKKIFPHLFDWLALLDFNVVIVLLLMIVVAGFNMISSLLIILFEKTSAIGLLKAMGMTSEGVGKVFRTVALDIIGRGLVWGNLLAFSLCLVQKYTKIITLNPENYFVKFVPIAFNIPLIIGVEALCVVLIMVILRITTLFIAKVSPDKTMRVS